MKQKALLSFALVAFLVSAGSSYQQKFQPKEPLKLTGKVDSEALKKTIQKAVDFLQKEKDADGWKFDGPKVTGATSKIGLRATPICVTAMACMALSYHGLDLDKSNLETVAKGLNFILNNKPKKVADDNQNWTYPFVLIFLSDQLRKETSEEMKTRIKDYINHVMECVKLGESKKGGWEYKDGKPTTFLTSGMLVALFDAKSVGIDIPEKMIQAGVTSLEKGHKDEGGYTYYGAGGPKETGTISDPKGSMGRLGSCELSMFLAGKRTAEDLKKAAESFLENRGQLDKVRGYTGTHVKNLFYNAAYYFMYGHYFMSRLSRYLDDETRKNLTPYLQEVFILIQESDGSWTDHPHSGKTYGTAMGLMTLGELAAPSIKPKKE